jgi:transglutaminase-like putative cysteine protease
LIALVICLVFSLLVVWAINGQQASWRDNEYGYDLIETRSVAADEAWAFPLPIGTTRADLADGVAGIVDVYSDSALTHRVGFAHESVNLGGLLPSVSFQPTHEWVAASPAWIGAKETYIGSQDAWPAGVYYIAERAWLTGQALDRPRVHEYIVEPSADTVTPPAFSMEANQGNPLFTWEAVPSASSYLIVKITPKITTGSSSGPAVTSETIEVIGSTSSTSWLASSQDSVYQSTHQMSDPVTAANTDFTALNAAGSSSCAPQDDSATAPGSDWDDSTLVYPSYAVLAVDAQSDTSIPQPQDGRQLVKATPVATADDTLGQMANEAGVEASRFVPDTLPVTMGDCSTQLLPVTATSLVATADETAVTLTYSANGSLLTGQATSPAGDQGAYTDMVSQGNQRGLILTYQWGPTEDMNSMDHDQIKAYAARQSVSATTPEAPYTWNGSSDMVKHIAANLFAGNTAIDLSAYVADPAAPLIIDAANEAWLQNPYIVDSFPVIGVADNVLYVDYEMTPDQRASEAAQVKAKVDQVVASIITDGMHDTAKASAINAYIAKAAVYDTAALEFSQSANLTRDSLINNHPHAWNAIGVLLDGTGVCASYATAFKALADAAGLATVTVTGYADDSGTAHEWIKANLGGVWRVIDPTWNSNVWEQVHGDVEMFFNLTDAQADRLQFDGFVVDSHINEYTAA